MEFARKLILLVFVLCVLFTVKNQNVKTKKGSMNLSSRSSNSTKIFTSPLISRQMFSSTKIDEEIGSRGSLEYNYYRESCPQAERIVRSVMKQLYDVRSDVAPALLRLVFHDCFIEGCDASVLLDATDEIDSEKDSPPNETLKGFDVIDVIKSKVEEVCPGRVSCADILVLAARESVVLAGGPFYPLETGRRDSTHSFPEVANLELPSPHGDLSRTMALFSSRGFDERETVSLLGAHSIGTIHCKFFLNRLYNFDGTDEPDPSMDMEFLDLLKSKCNFKSETSISSSPSRSPVVSPSLSPSPSSVNCSLSPLDQELGPKVDYEGPGSGFGTLYYRSLLQGKGILYADQQLITGEKTETWVRAYASDISLFRSDFAMAMMKLSNLRVLTLPMGQVRLNCSKVA